VWSQVYAWSQVSQPSQRYQWYFEIVTEGGVFFLGRDDKFVGKLEDALLISDEDEISLNVQALITMDSVRQFTVVRSVVEEG